jgi:hypothetical protein
MIAFASWRLQAATWSATTFGSVDAMSVSMVVPFDLIEGKKLRPSS